MKTSNVQIRIVIAESSAIIHSGLVVLLKSLPDFNIIPMEVSSMDALQNCFRGHAPELLIVNPMFEGGFNPADFRTSILPKQIKCIAMLSQLTDSVLLKNYDENITLYETAETLSKKLSRLQHIEPLATETENLSQREREIITCIVKGHSNKEIAEQLCLSIHTVITHRRNITRKLQIHSTAGLTIYAIVNKLINLSDIQQ